MMVARNISFSLTARQVELRQKTVTRRFGWWNLQPGAILTGVVPTADCHKAKKICLIRVVSVRMEPLNFMTEDILYGERECALEGFPDMSPDEYIRMRVKNHGAIPTKICNRIYFEYLDEEAEDENKESIRKKTEKAAG